MGLDGHGVAGLARRLTPVLDAESAKDPLFKKVADHYLAWRKV